MSTERQRELPTPKNVKSGLRLVRLVVSGVLLFCALPAIALESTFVTDESHALITVTAPGETARTEEASFRSAAGLWFCSMDLEQGQAYRVSVTSRGRTADGPRVIMPYLRMPAVKYTFHSGRNSRSAVSPRVVRSPSVRSPSVRSPSVRSRSEHRRAVRGAARPQSDPHDQGDTWVFLLVILLFSFVAVGALSFVIWFVRRPVTYAYSTGNTTLAPPEDWPSEITKSYKHLAPVGKIASGGLASVYLVRDGRYGGNYLALKLLHEQFCCCDEVDLKARFLDEPTIMQHLAGTGCVPLIYGRSKSSFSRPWFELEYLQDMVPLRRMVGGRARYRMNPMWLLPVMLGVTRAVRAVHHCGVVHRDLSPENIMLSLNGTVNVRIIDFGGAKYRHKTFAREDFFHNVTIPGQQIGKLLYSAPELWREGIQVADSRSDGYSIAVSFWEMTTGQPPFASEVAGRIRQSQATGDVSPAELCKQGVPAEVAGVLVAMLSPEQNARPDLDVLEGSILPHVG